jgi:hypothetical protein
MPGHVCGRAPTCANRGRQDYDAAAIRRESSLIFRHFNERRSPFRGRPARDESVVLRIAAGFAARLMQTEHAHRIFNAYALYLINWAVTKSTEV